MRSFNFADEALLLNQGVDSVWQNTTPWCIRKIRIKLAFACNPLPPAAGLVEVFANLWLSQPAAGAGPQFSADPYQYYGGPPPATWAADVANSMALLNPAVSLRFGGKAVPGGLFTTIVKALSTEPQNEETLLDDLSIAVPAASTFVWHMDAQGPPTDVEVSGTIYYELAG